MCVTVYFNGERIHNLVKCDLININNGVGSVLIQDLPNSPDIQSLLGRSGNLTLEDEKNWEVRWKYSREIVFYPFEECYWDKDLGVVSKLSYRLVKDNKIDNLSIMVGDMKRTVEAYRNELRAVGASGVLVTRIEEFLDRLDQDEDKLSRFEELHLTTRKRLISDYGICYVDSKEKFQ